MIEEDRHMESGYVPKRNCQHEYVDFYGAFGDHKDNPLILLSWVFCQKCLDKKLLRLDMSDFAAWQEDV